MATMKTVVSVFGMLLCLLVPISSGAGQAPDAVLDTPVGNASLAGQTVPQVAAKLAAIIHAPISAECLEDFWDAPQGPGATPVALTTTPETTVRTALDAAVANDPRYEWSFSQGWLHVMPRARGLDDPLDKHFAGALPAGGYLSERVNAVTAPYLPIGWHVQYLLRYGFHLAPGDQAALPESPTVRDALDALLSRTGAAGWLTRPVKEAEGQGVSVVLEILL